MENNDAANIKLVSNKKWLAGLAVAVILILGGWVLSIFLKGEPEGIKKTDTTNLVGNNQTMKSVYGKVISFNDKKIVVEDLNNGGLVEYKDNNSFVIKKQSSANDNFINATKDDLKIGSLATIMSRQDSPDEIKSVVIMPPINIVGIIKEINGKEILLSSKGEVYLVKIDEKTVLAGKNISGAADRDKSISDLKIGDNLAVLADYGIAVNSKEFVASYIEIIERN